MVGFQLSSDCGSQAAEGSSPSAMMAQFAAVAPPPPPPLPPLPHQHGQQCLPWAFKARSAPAAKPAPSGAAARKPRPARVLFSPPRRSAPSYCYYDRAHAAHPATPLLAPCRRTSRPSSTSASGWTSSSAFEQARPSSRGATCRLESSPSVVRHGQRRAVLRPRPAPPRSELAGCHTLLQRARERQSSYSLWLTSAPMGLSQRAHLVTFAVLGRPRGSHRRARGSPPPAGGSCRSPSCRLSCSALLITLLQAPWTPRRRCTWTPRRLRSATSGAGSPSTSSVPCPLRRLPTRSCSHPPGAGLASLASLLSHVFLCE